MYKQHILIQDSFNAKLDNLNMYAEQYQGSLVCAPHLSMTMPEKRWLVLVEGMELERARTTLLSREMKSWCGVALMLIGAHPAKQAPPSPHEYSKTQK